MLIISTFNNVANFFIKLLFFGIIKKIIHNEIISLCHLKSFQDLFTNLYLCFSLFVLFLSIVIYYWVVVNYLIIFWHNLKRLFEVQSNKNNNRYKIQIKMRKKK